jgi:hypothetical protein
METKTYELEDLAKMTPEQVNKALLEAVEIKAKAVVRDSEGNIKYSDPSLAGTYGEQE